MAHFENAGPKSASCMPEAGYLPIPTKLACKGVKDMLRISDARMSGTVNGTIVLHVSPDAASGGPLGLVRTGDRIRLSVKERRVDLLVDAAVPAQRTPGQASPLPKRGCARLYRQEVLQAERDATSPFWLQSRRTPSVYIL